MSAQTWEFFCQKKQWDKSRERKKSKKLHRRSLTRNEQLACFYFYREVGLRMHIRDIPENFDQFEQFNRNYEQKHFALAPSNRIIAKVTVNLFLSFYLPRLLWSLGRPMIYAAIDDPLMAALSLPCPPIFLRKMVTGTLKLRGKIVGFLPERREPLLGTHRKRPSYPEGYQIEELGTFSRDC